MITLSKYIVSRDTVVEDKLQRAENGSSIHGRVRVGATVLVLHLQCLI